MYFPRPLTLLLALGLLAGCSRAPSPAAPQVKAAAAPQAKGLFNQPVVIDAWANDALYRYDHDRDGAIDLAKDGWFRRDERVRHEIVRTEQRNPQGKLISVRYTTYTYTLRDLFYAADRDVDQRVTRAELIGPIAKFDADANGELTRRGLWGLITFKPKGEYDRFRDAYGERISDVDHRDVDVNDRAGQIAIEREAPVVDAPTIDEEALR